MHLGRLDLEAWKMKRSANPNLVFALQEAAPKLHSF